MNTFVRAVARAFFSGASLAATLLATTQTASTQTATTLSAALLKHRTWASVIVLASLSACTVATSNSLTFTNPPATDQLLPTGQRFFACDKISGARYMASTGFMIAGCKRLQPDNQNKYRVNEIQRIDLPEGEMWQIQLIGPEGLLWMPLPWHDWA